MNELVKLVSVKTGLSEEMSKVAVETVLNHVKDKLPAPAAAQVDAVVGGGSKGDVNLAQSLFD